MALLMCMGQFLIAQTTIQIGTGTSYASPIYPAYGYFDFGFSNIIYKASEIGRSGQITKIAVNVTNSPVNYTMTGQKIYMRHTTASSYSSGAYPGTSGYTLVFDGNVTFNGSGWHEINLSAAFNYNNIDNLEILWENRDGSYQNGFAYFAVTTNMSEYRLRRDYKDYSFPATCNTCATVNNIYNIKITLNDCPNLPGVAQANPPVVVPGGTSTISITEQPAGSTLQWQSSTDGVNFSNMVGVTQTSFTTPQLTSPVYYRALVNNNGCYGLTNAASVLIDTTGLTNIAIGSGTAQFDKYPFYNFYEQTWSSIIYKASEINSTGKLTHLSFFVDNNSSITATNQKIYVRHTTQNEFPDATYPTTTGFTLVYDGSITYNGAPGWKEIALQNLFDYDGVSNIEILFENRAGSYSLNYPVFRGETNKPEYRVKRDYKDGEFPNNCVYCNRYKNILNVKMKFLPCGINAGTISATTNKAFPGSSVDINLNNYDQGSSIIWQQSKDNVNFNTVGTSGSSVSHLMKAEKAHYRAIVTKGCSKFADIVTITADTLLDTVAIINSGLSYTEKFPTNGYYDFGWSNFIFQANEIGKKGQITQLAFYVESSPTVVLNNQKIWLRHTTESGYTNSNYPGTNGFTLVYDGSLAFDGSGWKEIALSNFFDYDGTSNLEILVENRDGSWSGNFPTFRYTSGFSSYRLRRDYKDSNFPETCYLCNKFQYLPNTKIRIYNSWLSVAPNEVTICKGDEIQLQAFGGDSYVWSPATGLNDANVATPIATPEITTVYSVTGTLSGQKAQASVTVSIDETCFPLSINTIDIGDNYENEALYYDLEGAGLEGTYLAGSERKFKAYRPYPNELLTIELNFKTESKGSLFKIAYDVNENAEYVNPRAYVDGQNISLESLATVESGKIKFTRSKFEGIISIKEPATKLCTENPKNWVTSKTYAQDGTLLSEEKTYSDYLGRTTQVHSKLLTNNDVLATQTIYDALGRPVVTTLPAPLNQGCLTYKENFITLENQPYSFNDFDQPNYSQNQSVLSYGEVDKPRPVENTQSGTLGWYYSNNNIIEPYVPTSSYPYSRVEYNDITLGGIKRASMAGDALRMGAGDETQTYTMPASGELHYVFGFSKGWTIESILDANDITLEDGTVTGWIGPEKVSFEPNYKVTKTISVDQNGNEGIVFTDNDGKTIASCMSGSVNGVNRKEMQVVSILPTDESFNYIDIHLPQGCESSLNLENNTFEPFITYNIIDLKSGQYVEFDNSSDYKGKTPNLPAGCYRIIYKGGSSNSGNGLAVQYKLNYYDFTLNYYDQANRLVTQVSPLGIDQNYTLSFIPSHTKVQSGFSGSPVSLSSPTSGTNELGFAIALPVENETQFTNLSVSLRKKLPAIQSESWDIKTRESSGTTGVSGSTFNNDASYIPVDLTRNEQVTGSQIIQDLDAESAFDYSAASINTNIETIEIDPYPGWDSKVVIHFNIVDNNGSSILNEGYVFATKQTIHPSLGNNNYTYKWSFSEPVVTAISPNKSVTTSGAKVVITSIASLYYDPFLKAILPSNAAILNDLELRFDGFIYKGISEPKHSMGTTNRYNSLGWVLTSYDPDKGATEFVYRKDGKIRFSQNEKQRKSSGSVFNRKFSYTNYDAVGRIIESGEYNPVLAANPYYFESHENANTIDPSGSPSPENAQSIHNALESNIAGSGCTQQSYFLYDVPDAALPVSGYVQRNTRGAVSKSWNADNTTWYSYDTYGRTEWIIKNISGLGAKTLNYTYDIKGNIITVAYQKETPAESFYHHYTYDRDGRLIKSETSTDGLSKTLQAKYIYYRHGPLKRVEIAEDLQGVDYVYTINGWLKSMNDPTLTNRDFGKDGYTGKNSHFSKDVFGMALDYFSGDYIRANTYVQTANTTTTFSKLGTVDYAPSQYNGNIKAQRWQTKNPNLTQYANGQLLYAYEYDAKSQLKEAVFGTLNSDGNLNGPLSAPQTIEYGNQFNPLDDYAEWGITYDANGNLLSLSRNAYGRVENGTTLSAEMDEFTYNYSLSNGKRTNNKLQYVNDAISINTNLMDIKNQASGNYLYDELGQMTQDNSEGNKIEYDAYGKVIAVRDLNDQLKVKYVYDENGQKIKKEDYSEGQLEKTTWYLRDAQGSLVSVYDATNSTIDQKELNVFGASRIGVWDKTSNKFTYELNDHLGNTRATFEKGYLTSLTNTFDGISEDENRWSGKNNITTSEAHSGTSSIELRLNPVYPVKAKAIGSYIDVPVKDGVSVSVKVFHKNNLSNAVPANAGIKFELLDANGNFISSGAQFNNLTQLSNGTWVSESFTYNVTSTSTELKLRIYPQNLSSNAVWFDDVKITISGGSDFGFAVAAVTGSTDYYPFGMEMPGRTVTGASFYRYGYQGQFAEKNSHTGWNEFELRNWDGRLGRWTNIDPYGQYHSPYLGMGNNPVRRVDPDGGWDDIIELDGKGYEIGRIKMEGEDIFVHTMGTFEFTAYRNDPFNFSSEAERYGFNGTLDQYKAKYGINSREEWSAAHGEDFYKWVDAMDKAERERVAMLRLKFFVDGFSTISTVVAPTQAMNAFNSAIKPNSFSVTPRGTNYTTVYRNFGSNELKSLELTNFKRFEIGNNFGSKQFWLDKQGLNWWKTTSFSKPHTAKITVLKSSLKDGFRFEDAGKYKAISFDNQRMLNNFNKGIINIKID